MKRLLKAEWYLWKCRLRRYKYAKLVSLLLLAVLVMSLLCIRNVIGKFFVIDTMTVEFYFSIIYVLLLLTSLPFYIYKKIMNARKANMLFLAGISKKAFYIYQALSEIVKISIFIELAVWTFVLPLEKDQNVLFLVKTEVYFVVFFFITLVGEMLAQKKWKETFYKRLLCIAAVLEIFSFFIIHSLSGGKLDVQISPSNINYYGIIILLVISGIVMIGFVFIKRNHTEMQRMGNSNLTICKKDFKILSRDFDSMKYLIVTVIIFVCSTIIDTNKTEFSSIFILALLFSCIITIQVTWENMEREKKYFVIYDMAGYPKSVYLKEKRKYTRILSEVIVLIYSVALFITQQVEFYGIILYLTGIYIYLNILCRLVTDCVYRVLNISEKEGIIKKIVNCIGVFIKTTMYILLTSVMIYVIFIKLYEMRS